MVFNATFKNILALSWRSVLLVEETGETTDLSQVTDKPYHEIVYRVHLVINVVRTHIFKAMNLKFDMQYIESNQHINITWIAPGRTTIKDLLFLSP